MNLTGPLWEGLTCHSACEWYVDWRLPNYFASGDYHQLCSRGGWPNPVKQYHTPWRNRSDWNAAMRIHCLCADHTHGDTCSDWRLYLHLTFTSAEEMGFYGWFLFIKCLCVVILHLEDMSLCVCVCQCVFAWALSAADTHTLGPTALFHQVINQEFPRMR